jgi:6-phospho-beta-glucosidase
VPEKSVSYSYVGLNHLNFAFNIKVDGRLITDEEFDHVAEVAARGALDPVLIKKLRLIPSPYLQYFFHTSKKVKDLKEAAHTRGEVVQILEKEVFDAYADPSQDSKPEALAKRGGGGYSEVALDVMKAIHTNQEKVIIVNVPNRGAIRDLPGDAVVEIPCVVNAAGIHAIHQPSVPQTVWGLIAAVKNYEQLAVEAAVTGSKDLALMALLAHPLVGDYDIALPLMDELLEANRPYLPQFYAGA